MKKNKLLLLSLLSLVSLSGYANTLNYSLDIEKTIYEIKTSKKTENFCQTAIKNTLVSDKIGQNITKSTCANDYINLNVLKNWGDELLELSMKNNKKPTIYNSALPIGPTDTDKFLALITLKDNMFFTFIDINNLDESGKPKKQLVTNEQYLFFKDIYNKIIDKNNKFLKPVTTQNIFLGTNDPKELAKSKVYLSYAQNLINSQNNLIKIKSNLDYIFNNFDNYKNYLEYIYNGQADDLVMNPSSFKNHSFTKLQCNSIQIALFNTEYNFEKLQSENKFLCK